MLPPFLRPYIVPMFHAVSFASVCISQKIWRESRTPRARITPNSALLHPRACLLHFIFNDQLFLQHHVLTLSAVSSTSADNPQNILCLGRRGQWSRGPLRTTSLLRRTCILKIREVFTDFIITGYNFHFTLCLWRQIQNVGLTVEYKETEQVRITCRIVLFWHTCF